MAAKHMPQRRLAPVASRKVQIADRFWKPRMETNRTVTLPLQYERNRETGALTAYQWQWDPNKPPRPWRVWIGDVGKWIEAASYVLGTQQDPALSELAHDAVQNVLRGQKPDGYLYANPIAPDKRWTNLRDLHELYDVGHAIEGAIAYYEATGRREFLDAMCRCADLLDANFGPEEGKRHGYDGHPEIELALVKLHRATGRKRYLNLAKFFVDERGREPNYFSLEARARGEDPAQHGTYTGSPGQPYVNLQAHQPVRQQQDAVGHAVRAMYLYCGMADVAVETGDAELLEACRRLWKSATRRRMYVIGAVGSTAHGEAFTFDCDLPNETAYAETCANIALAFFAHRMLQVEADSEYADVMERALYNGVLSGVSLDGRRYFYANHLTVCPEASRSAAGHIAAGRQEWFGCACCPPNIARLIAGIARYAYSTSSDALYVHLYIAGSAECELAGTRVAVRQQTDYPWQGKVTITVEPEPEARFAVALRIPGWCRGAKLKVNGKPVALARFTRKGYAVVRRAWAKGDRVDLTLPMPVERLEANPRVRMDCGKVALQRGPIVYCLEEVDNGKDLADVALPQRSRLVVATDSKLGGVLVIRGRALRRHARGWKNVLYRSVRSSVKAFTFKAVPYCMWGNRGEGEMLVWVRECP